MIVTLVTDNQDFRVFLFILLRGEKTEKNVYPSQASHKRHGMIAQFTEVSLCNSYLGRESAQHIRSFMFEVGYLPRP